MEFFLDQQDFQCFPQRKRVSSCPKLGDMFSLKNMIMNLICFSDWYQESYQKNQIHHSQFHHPNNEQNRKEFQQFSPWLVLPLGEVVHIGHLFQWKFVFFMIFSSLKHLDSYGYTINKHSTFFGCKSFLLSCKIRSHAVDLNTLKFDTSGLCPK